MKGTTMKGSVEELQLSQAVNETRSVKKPIADSNWSNERSLGLSRKTGFTLIP
jgi:hypothetical protein